MALARKYRLNRKDLNYVLRQGKTVRNSFFFIRFLKNETGFLRIAVIVSAKILKRAILRNRLKRICTEIIRSGHFLEKSYDLVITATLSIVDKTSKEIKKDLEETIKKIFSQ
ncbi:MAG: ribonuclease P protein component [Candidatus Yanofskybacteria bacterium]|nr:ribonuclease P protein component [Candidatus Yanofskybacteria bacterium]